MGEIYCCVLFVVREFFGVILELVDRREFFFFIYVWKEYLLFLNYIFYYIVFKEVEEILVSDFL